MGTPHVWSNNYSDYDYVAIVQNPNGQPNYRATFYNSGEYAWSVTPGGLNFTDAAYTDGTSLFVAAQGGGPYKYNLAGVLINSNPGWSGGYGLIISNDRLYGLDGGWGLVEIDKNTLAIINTFPNPGFEAWTTPVMTSNDDNFIYVGPVQNSSGAMIYKVDEDFKLN